MKIEEIKELVALLETSKLNVLEICEGESRIRLEKTAPVITAAMPAAMPAGISMAQGALSANGTDVPADAAPAVAGKPVKSPMVGVFYGASKPGDKPFVSVGSHVEKGDVLCIVEAMKLMNEITAEVSGEITQVCAADGDVVEFGQPLFFIK